MMIEYLSGGTADRVLVTMNAAELDGYGVSFGHMSLADEPTRVLLRDLLSMVTRMGLRSEGEQVRVDCAPAGEGAKRLFAAVPEADKAALLGYFYTTPYALVRDIGMPIYLKFTTPEEQQQYNAILAALPPAAPGGAFAGAMWVRKDGALKFALRFTADEIKTYGAVVTALGSADDDDDDDE